MNYGNYTTYLYFFVFEFLFDNVWRTIQYIYIYVFAQYMLFGSNNQNMFFASRTPRGMCSQRSCTATIRCLFELRIRLGLRELKAMFRVFEPKKMLWLFEHVTGPLQLSKKSKNYKNYKTIKTTKYELWKLYDINIFF